MNDSGVHVTFEESGCNLSKENLILAKGIRYDTLFGLYASTFCNFDNVTDNSISCKLWHHRMGHIDEKVLKTLINKNTVDGLSGYSIDFDFRKHCVYGSNI